MKKSAWLLMLLSTPMILSACGGGNPGGDDSHSGAGSSAQDSSDSAQSGQSDASHESSYISSSSSSSEATSIDYTIGWSQEVLDEMEPHLGGHAIPFIDLPGRILTYWTPASTTYNYSAGGYVSTPAFLSIISTGAFDAALAGAAKMTYQKAGWDVTFDTVNLTMHAEEASLGIVVEFYGYYDPNEHFTNPQIDVYYTEPFIIPTDGHWRASTLELLESIDVQSPHGLPYAYLGTLAEEATTIDLGSGITGVEIKGLAGGWDTYSSEIIAAARASFPRSKKWAESSVTITVGSGYYYTYSYTGYCFTKTFNDGYTVKAVLYGRPEGDSYYYDSDPKTPFLRVWATH